MDKDKMKTVNTGDASVADDARPLSWGERTRREQRRKRLAVRQMVPFLTALFLITVIAWLVPLRPTVSDAEKRELEKFGHYFPSTMRGTMKKAPSVFGASASMAERSQRRSATS